ncbi:MAG: TonB-dependent receptor [Cardiobacteriaceae bacterium]|nr:TonB-dependent receptor [Cardiobacteriaceae bacterium]
MPRQTLLATAILAVLGAVHAQEHHDASDTVVLDPIVVRVRGISESSVAVPLSVQTLDQETIERRQFRAAEDSIRHTPGIEIISGGDPGNSFLWVRGTGSLSHASLDDNTVGLRFDGASQGVFGLARNLYDIDGIEIGKGPQGTLYGHNAEVGIVNIHSRDPEAHFAADIEAGLGNNHLKQLKTAVNIPLNENMAARVAAMGEWRDDYVRERATGKTLNTQRSTGIRGKFRWQIAPATDLLFTLYHDRKNNFLPLMLFPPIDKTPQFAKGALDYRSRRDSTGAHLDVHHESAHFRFDSLTRYSDHDGHLRTGYLTLDGLPARYRLLNVPAPLQPKLDAFFNQTANNRQHQHDRVRQIEQEFRFTALPDAPVQWVAGLYLQERQRDFRYDARRNLLPLPAPMPPLNADAYNAELHRRYRTSGQAIFGEATWPVGENVKIITGARLAHEKTRYRAEWHPNPGNPLGANGAQSDAQNISHTALTGRLGLDYAFTPDWHLYGLYSRGHKSAGFSDFSTNLAYGKSDTPYHAGHIDAFEIGVKGEGERFTFASALFHNRVKNDKISVALYPSFLTESFNVDTRSQGVEVSGEYRITPGLRLDGSLSLTNAEVTRIGKTEQNITRKGNRIPQVPRVAVRLGVEYRKALPLSFVNDAELIARADLSHTGKRAAEPNNRYTLPAHTLIDASLGIANGKGEILLWGRNLTNRRYFRYAYLPDGFAEPTGYPGEGRSYGIAFKYHFE